MYTEIKNEAGTLIGVRRQSVDSDALIPVDLTNREYQEFLRWLAEGNIPRPPVPGGMKTPVWDDAAQAWKEDPAMAASRAVKNAARARLRTDRANGGPPNPRQMWNVLDDIMTVYPGLLIDE